MVLMLFNATDAVQCLWWQMLFNATDTFQCHWDSSPSCSMQFNATDPSCWCNAFLYIASFFNIIYSFPAFSYQSLELITSITSLELNLSISNNMIRHHRMNYENILRYWIMFPDNIKQRRILVTYWQCFPFWFDTSRHLRSIMRLSNKF